MEGTDNPGTDRKRTAFLKQVLNFNASALHINTILLHIIAIIPKFVIDERERTVFIDQAA